MSKTMRPRSIHALVPLVLVAFGVPGWVGCKKPAPVELAPVKKVHVDAVDVVLAPMPRTLALNGTLRGERQTDLAANASGRVLETLVERGSVVKQGDVVAKL